MRLGNVLIWTLMCMVAWVELNTTRDFSVLAPKPLSCSTITKTRLSVPIFLRDTELRPDPPRYAATYMDTVFPLEPCVLEANAPVDLLAPHRENFRV